DAVRQVTLALNDDPISFQKSLGGAGAYEVVATKIPNTKSWRIDSLGTDSAGARRRVVADAVPEELFSNAFFSQSSLTLASGATVDSFLNGTTARNMCTGKGVVGSNAADQVAWNNQGVGDVNCRQWAGDAFPYAFDACISYARENPADFDSRIKCPPDPLTMKRTPGYEVPVVDLANVTPVPQPDAYRNCTTPIPPGIYYWQSVTLAAGCSLQGTTGDVVIYSFGPVNLGSPGAASTNFVNKPPDDAGICPHDHTQQGGRDALTDKWNDPAHYYCPGWAKRLQIWVKSGANATVTLNNHLKFWGLLVAPTQAIVGGGGQGSPQVFVWGAIIGQTANLNAQFTMHYDESLAQLSSSTFRIRNWREAPPV
ncbi:MAG TPA: hypothetical protein VFO65_14250, partial [Acidimicrobiales bacterium]|nr:hypothetical protein [Acidimicrobiales bacterium]